MIHSKPAKTDFPILDVIKNRWSPVGFDSSRGVSREKIDSLLEAARWAPSSFNEQPWQYVIGIAGDAVHGKLADCLVEGNSWAKEAPVLMLSIAKTFFDHKHKPNRHHMHDTGAANVLMHLQATDLDLAMHQMEGFSVEKAREHFSIGDEYEPASMIAIGYPSSSVDSLPDGLRERDSGERQRKPHASMLWGL